MYKLVGGCCELGFVVSGVLGFGLGLFLFGDVVEKLGFRVLVLVVRCYCRWGRELGVFGSGVWVWVVVFFLVWVVWLFVFVFWWWKCVVCVE